MLQLVKLLPLVGVRVVVQQTGAEVVVRLPFVILMPAPWAVVEPVLLRRLLLLRPCPPNPTSLQLRLGHAGVAV